MAHMLIIMFSVVYYDYASYFKFIVKNKEAIQLRYYIKGSLN
jgi:hypothetical protein